MEAAGRCFCVQQQLLMQLAGVAFRERCTPHVAPLLSSGWWRHWLEVVQVPHVRSHVVVPHCIVCLIPCVPVSVRISCK
jgi:hypothetical protein